MENLIAAVNEVDVLFEHHVGFVLVKAGEITDDCRANVASMRLRFQIDLSEEIDGVGHGVLAIRIEHRASLAKHELEMVILLVVVSRPSGSIESEVDAGVLRSESPRKLLGCRTTDRIDHFNEERELNLVDVLCRCDKQPFPWSDPSWHYVYSSSRWWELLLHARTGHVLRDG